MSLLMNMETPTLVHLTQI